MAGSLRAAKKKLRVLLVEDTPADVVLIERELRRAGLEFACRRVESRDGFLRELAEHPPDVILSDHGVPGFDGFAALAEARSRCPEVPFIFVSGARTDETEAERLRSGADDYVLKSGLHLLAPAMDRALQHTSARVRHGELEAALLDAEEHLRVLAEEAREYATFMVDDAGRVATWNPAAVRLLGFEPTEMLGQDFSSFFAPENHPAMAAKDFTERAAREGRAEQDLACRRKNGQTFPARVILTPVRRDGKASRGFLCLVRDASRPKEQGKTHADPTLRELEEFTYAMALNLRTPVRHIESFTEMLLRSAADRLDQKNLGYLKTIAESTRHLSRLGDDLFTFARISQAEMYRLHIRLDDLVREVAHDLRPEWEGRQVQWIFDPLPEVEADPVMLWLVFTNLLSNALKFTRTRPKAVIHVSGRTTPTEYLLTVHDNGVGFDMPSAHRLFRVFQRLHPREEFEGMGLGLANVRRIIQRQGGRVWAEGVVDESATFHFTLPRRPVKP